MENNSENNSPFDSTPSVDPAATSPVVEPIVAPAFEPSPIIEPSLTQPVEPVPLPSKEKGRKGLKIFLIILLILIALGAIGYSAYAYFQNKTQQASISDKDQQIKTLNSQVASLKTANVPAVATTPVAASGNVIPIRELGVSITVPDSIKDLTYSYKSGNGAETVTFSTKTITDKYSNTGSCTSFSTAPPLGDLSKVNGQHGSNQTTGAATIRQFSTYYLSYEGPQSDCVDTQASVADQIQALKDSIATIKEL